MLELRIAESRLTLPLVDNLRRWMRENDPAPLLPVK
jgi:hypothetical protein